MLGTSLHFGPLSISPPTPCHREATPGSGTPGPRAVSCLVGMVWFQNSCLGSMSFLCECVSAESTDRWSSRRLYSG